MVYPLTPFPYQMTPMSGIAAASYADGTTFMRELAYLKQYLTETLHPEISAEFTRIIEDFQQGITNAENAVGAAEDTWQERFDQFMADLTAQVALLNDNAVASLVANALSATGQAVAARLTPAALDGSVTALLEDEASDAGTAAREIATTVGVARTGFEGEVRALVDDQIGDTKDNVVSSLFATATTTRGAVDARVATTADGVLTGLLASPASGTTTGVVKAINAAPVHAAGNRHVTVGQVREPVTVSRYSAFPSVTRLNDGRLFMVWYEATDHIGSRDGVVMGAYSSNLGRTWTAKQTVVTIPGQDLRDPTVSTSRDGKTLYLTYIRCSAAKPRDGFFLLKSSNNGQTWTPAVRIDPDGTNGAGTAPIVELSNGQLFATWFGKDNGEAYDSVYYATSTDGGATWGARVRLLNGVADGRDYPEPFPAVIDNTIVLMFRWGIDDGIGRMVSSNNGSTWSVPARLFGGSGRPSALFTASGTLIVQYRNNDAGNILTQHGMIRTSTNQGGNWTQPKLLEPAVGGWWVYSWMVEVAPGMIYSPSAVELSSTVTEMSGRYLIEGAGVSPFGDTTASPLVRAMERRQTVAAVDTFDRQDSASIGRTDNGLPWVSSSPANIASGAIQNNAISAFGLHVVNVRTSNQEVEADLMWMANAGAYLVFRYADPDNYLMVGVEASGGSIGLYRVVGGAATQIDTAAISWPEGIYHRIKATSLNGTIRVSVEGVPIFSTVSTIAPVGQWVGLRLGVAGAPGAIHRARNFIAHRRSGFAG